jgi:hypothetical protein
VVAETVTAGVARGAGVTLLETAEAVEVPAELVAVTVKVYAVPFVSPVTVNGEPAPLTAMFPGLEVTV